MSRADELAREREALRERAADQRLAIVRNAAAFRQRLSTLRALFDAAGLLASTARALWRRFGRRHAAPGGAAAEPAPPPSPEPDGPGGPGGPQAGVDAGPPGDAPVSP